MKSKENTPLLLIGVQTFTATLEISVAVSQKTENQPTSGPSNIILGHIPKGCSLIPQGHLLYHVHRALFVIARTWKQPKFPSTEEWQRKCGTFIQCSTTQWLKTMTS